MRNQFSKDAKDAGAAAEATLAHVQTGARIRARRVDLGLRQGDLARQVGISGSYLNLIEHDKRRIGGKVLIDLARALDVEPAALTEGADAGLTDALTAAAEQTEADTPPETERIDTLAGRFPGWVSLIVAQADRLSALEADLASLQNRLTHDPVLAETMHDVLSSATAIRSMADILASDRSLERQWRDRFHRNLHEEAERLAKRASGLLSHLQELPEDGMPLPTRDLQAGE